MTDPNFYIETPRLYISQYLPDNDAHCQFLVEMFNSPAFLQNCTGRNIRTVEAARTYLRTVTVKGYEDNGYGAWIVSLKPPGSPAGVPPSSENTYELIGSGGIFQRKCLAVPDIGYSVLPQYEGKGYATEIGKAVLKYAVEKLGRNDVIGMTTDENEKSKRILQKLGFVQWGTLNVSDFDTPSVVFVLPGVKEVKLVPPVSEPVPDQTITVCPDSDVRVYFPFARLSSATKRQDAKYSSYGNHVLNYNKSHLLEMADPSFYIETPRLFLSQFLPESDAHCQFLVDMFTSPLFISTGRDRGIRTLEHARNHIRTVFIKTYEDHGFGGWIASLKPPATPGSVPSVPPSLETTYELIGTGGLCQRKALTVPDVGYSILPQHQGQGYATEIGAAVLKYARESLGRTDVVGMTSEDNETSKHILQKLGFVYYGLVKLSDFDDMTVMFVQPGVTEVKILPPPPTSEPSTVEASTKPSDSPTSPSSLSTSTAEK
ncbi:hypothetical protein BV898_07608 [Hypsibius exemplaris]|uniref:N-acetyltransferase domain-containing protein n=1 Tax=Hypsibius exemplaris TaxID=2072580 RepID=A0A1W0WT93_HYPEX|nr:hypothetical protein BV898_07608 [Hypsibius exemplaris]